MYEGNSPEIMEMVEFLISLLFSITKLYQYILRIPYEVPEGPSVIHTPFAWWRWSNMKDFLRRVFKNAEVHVGVS